MNNETKDLIRDLLYQDNVDTLELILMRHLKRLLVNKDLFQDVKIEFKKIAENLDV